MIKINLHNVIPKPNICNLCKIHLKCIIKFWKIERQLPYIVALGCFLALVRLSLSHPFDVAVALHAVAELMATRRGEDYHYERAENNRKKLQLQCVSVLWGSAIANVKNVFVGL